MRKLAVVLIFFAWGFLACDTSQFEVSPDANAGDASAEYVVERPGVLDSGGSQVPDTMDPVVDAGDPGGDAIEQADDGIDPADGGGDTSTLTFEPGGAFKAIPVEVDLTSVVIETKNLGGRDSTDPYDEYPDALESGISPMDTVGDLAVAALWYQNSYYTAGEYNDNDWMVTHASLSGFGKSVPIYTIEPAASWATSFVASKHALFYRFPSVSGWTVWELNAGTFTVLEELGPGEIVADGFTRLTSLVANDVTTPRTLAFTPSSMTLTTLNSLGEGVYGATVAQNKLGQVVQVHYSVPGTPYSTGYDFVAGPASWRSRYGQNRHFFGVQGVQDYKGVVWQDAVDAQVRVTWIHSEKPGTYNTIDLSSVPNTVLAAATADPIGTLVYLLVSRGDGVPNTVREAWLVKAFPDGGEIAIKQLDTGANGLDMVYFASEVGGDGLPNHATLQWSGNTIGLMLGRKKTPGGDGLNHQGGIAVVYSAETLERLAHHGQTSGHSFCNTLVLRPGGAFLGLDLGDNYPRGVNLHSFDTNSIDSRVVYTFKTHHGTTPDSPAQKFYDLYEEISGPSGTFYKWSNDNETYSELGGVAETSAGISVLFSSERGLDNALVGASLNVPRNLGLVLVRSNFASLPAPPSPNVVTDDLVLSQGAPPEEAGFYGFNGGWHPQRNAGVVWLTDYADLGHNASRVKLHPLDDNRLLVLWELWTADFYQETYGMIVSPSGEVVVLPTALGTNFRLGWRDDPFTMATAVANIAGNGPSGRLVLTLFFP